MQILKHTGQKTKVANFHLNPNWGVVNTKFLR